MKTYKTGSYATSAANKALLLTKADASLGHGKFSKTATSTATVVPASDRYERGRSPTPRQLLWSAKGKSIPSSVSRMLSTAPDKPSSLPIPQKP